MNRNIPKIQTKVFLGPIVWYITNYPLFGVLIFIYYLYTVLLFTDYLENSCKPVEICTTKTLPCDKLRLQKRIGRKSNGTDSGENSGKKTWKVEAISCMISLLLFWKSLFIILLFGFRADCVYSKTSTFLHHVE